jgi:hypothetical protein
MFVVSCSWSHVYQLIAELAIGVQKLLEECLLLSENPTSQLDRTTPGLDTPGHYTHMQGVLLLHLFVRALGVG